AGETRRDGIELGAEAFATENLTLTGAYTWSDFRFRDRSQGLSGNRLPGLPEHNLFLEAAWEQGPWMAAVETEAVSDVYVSDANEVSASGYGLVHLRGQYELPLGGSRLTLGAGIQNLFERDYFSNIRVNANGGAFYEPAPGRTIHASVSLTFQAP
ncbi:MAG: TonB-dependent receptor domain-containing protein, partial [Pseudomonadota bacterium]